MTHMQPKFVIVSLGISLKSRFCEIKLKIIIFNGSKSNANEMPDIVPERTDEDSALNRSGQLETVKCTVIGDGAIGKTSLIVSYTTNDYPQDYKPTVHDFYTGKLFLPGTWL